MRVLWIMANCAFSLMDVGHKHTNMVDATGVCDMCCCVSNGVIVAKQTRDETQCQGCIKLAGFLGTFFEWIDLI